jgi:hypothetical protein
MSNDAIVKALDDAKIHADRRIFDHEFLKFLWAARNKNFVGLPKIFIRPLSLLYNGRTTCVSTSSPSMEGFHDIIRRLTVNSEIGPGSSPIEVSTIYKLIHFEALPMQTLAYPILVLIEMDVHVEAGASPPLDVDACAFHALV